jgi:uncharacterized linocin/CFP29 family protein
MDHRNAQVGWTEAQWNRVREEVLQAWQRVRVAGSFLPIYSQLPPSTQVVPSGVLKGDGSVDDEATASLLEIALPVRLSRQQIMEEDLSSALLQFRRRATQLGQLEDWFIFNGTYPSSDFTLAGRAAFEAEKAEKKAGLSDYRPALDHLDASDSSQRARISGIPKSIDGLNHDKQVEGMRKQNPGSLGLIRGPRPEQEQNAAKALQAQYHNNKMQVVIINAINSLENHGYVAPYVCIFGREPFQEAFTPIGNSTVLPRDRIEPLIGRELLHASGIDIPPYKPERYQNLNTEEWPRRGVLLSMANEPIDLALAAEATPEFRQVDMEGRYVFSVFERFALRIKDARAIVPLMFEKEAEKSGGATEDPRSSAPFRSGWRKWLSLRTTGSNCGTGRRMRRRLMGRPCNARGYRSRWAFGPPIPRTR